MRHLTTLLSAVVAIGVAAPSLAEAQTLALSPGSYTAPPATLVSFAEYADFQGGSKKSPVLAGALSFFIFPGVGSYYAGNGGHGTRHLLLGLGSATVMIVGLAQAADEVLTDGTIDTGSITFVLVGALVYSVNALWSVVAAISDAGDTNSGIASVIQPEFRVLASSSPTISTFVPKDTQRVGIQVVRFSF